jgi:TolA-binding protein
MDEYLPIDDQLTRYLDNEMPELEKQLFEERLNADPELHDRLDKLRSAISAIRYYGINQKVAGIRKEMEPLLMANQPVSKGGKVITMRKRPFRYAIAAAAVLVFLIAGIEGYRVYKLSPDKVFAEGYVAYTEGGLRSGNNSTPPLEKAYQEKQYRQVIELSRNINPPIKEKLLTGLSYLQLNQLNDAIGQFKNILNSSDNTFKPDAEYYLALTYLKNKQYGNALPLLKKIRSDQHHLYHHQITVKVIRDVQWLKWKSER